MAVESRFVRGFIAGMLVTIPAVLWEYFTHDVIHLSRHLFRNFVSVLIYGRIATNTWEALFSQAVQLGFGGAVGSAIALFVHWTGTDGVYLKSMILSVATWFLINAIGTAFRIPVLYHVELGTAVSHLIGALIIGALWPLAMIWLERWIFGEIRS